ncbi:SRPBCC family protein [Marmoricola sp. URHB0036]|uniref:SRPBCC family protein n=1 Tax=Marmoricola sp. URHB0036 TaxID=1298863 RepID=UPI00041700DD|nr:SRPBCC family protein [Marmoricola sp. URHB0036]
MTTVERVINTTPQRVWEVLADGWLYPLWVVGATRMRDVDEDWPAVGSRIHHSVGVWPAVLDDDTEITACEPLQKLSLRAKAWPFLGEADVTLDLSVQGAGTRVVMSEDAASGPGKLVPKPVRAPGIQWRNTESLRRLAFLAERRP